MTVWRYQIHNQKYEGWAILFLDDAGCFAVLSDYGNFAYRWPMNGMPEGKGIREFLLGCDDWYLSHKLSPNQEYDGPETLKAVKKCILEGRKGRYRDDKWARAEFDLLDLYDLGHEDDFRRWLDETKIEDAYELVRHRPSVHITAFLERAWPRLKLLIEQELAARTVPKEAQ